MSPETLIARYPRLYHMAEDGAWSSIQRHGLLSTSSLLDLYGINGDTRADIEARHRPESVEISSDDLPPAVVRDQKPMSDGGLRRCLKDGLAPEAWYRTLNGMVFFWVTEERLQRLMNARPYRTLAHAVLTLDTASVVDAHLADVRLSPINSGCTKPYPQPRGKDTFLSIADYPFEAWDQKRKGVDPIVEFALQDRLPNIERHVIQVQRMRAGEVLADLRF